MILLTEKFTALAALWTLLIIVGQPAHAKDKHFPPIELTMVDANGEALHVRDPKGQLLPEVPVMLSAHDNNGTKLCFDIAADDEKIWRCEKGDYKYLWHASKLDGKDFFRLSTPMKVHGKRELTMFMDFKTGEPVCTNLNPNGALYQFYTAKGVPLPDLPEHWYLYGGRYETTKWLLWGLVDKTTGRKCNGLRLTENEIAAAGSVLKITCMHPMTNAQINVRLVQQHNKQCRNDPNGNWPNSFLEP